MESKQMEARMDRYELVVSEYAKSGDENVLLGWLESELREHDDVTIWFLTHDEMFAGNLIENGYSMDGEEIVRNVELAKKEIALLYQYGYVKFATKQAEMLNAAIAAIRIQF